MTAVAENDDSSNPPVVSAEGIRDGLRGAGVREGSVVLVHASLSAFGLVPGGEQSVVHALRSAVGTAGTIVMPSQSWQLCDPDFLDDPALSPTLRRAVRDALPIYDRSLTPTRSMGRIAELFRLQPDTRRSPHPHRSFAAAGLYASAITNEHEWDSPFGESSPLARLYDLNAQIILLGVGFDKCTALHLAEARALIGREHPTVPNGTAVSASGRREWVTWDEPVVRDDDFAQIGRAFTANGHVRQFTSGQAQCCVMPIVPLVDFAVEQMRNRNSN